MSVHLQTRPAAPRGTATARPVSSLDLDMDALDAALDRGDLETVRCMLGLSRDAWQLVLAGL